MAEAKEAGTNQDGIGKAVPNVSKKSGVKKTEYPKLMKAPDGGFGNAFNIVDQRDLEKKGWVVEKSPW